MPLPPKAAVRAVAGVILIGVGYCAVTRSFASALAKADPVAASEIAGGDSRIRGMAAQVLLERARTTQDRQNAAQQATQALKGDGTAVSAAATLGLYGGLTNDDKSSQNWFDYSQKLSRRDLSTQIYFLEKAVAAGDIAGALNHYDIALRTSDAAPAVLYPVLRAAVANPDIEVSLAKMLAGKPIWATGFLADLSNNGPDFDAAARLMIRTQRAGFPIPANISTALVSSLVSRGNVASAWRYYAAMHPGATRAIVRNAEFDPQVTDNSPFDWQISAEDGVSASLNTGGNAGVLDYRLSPTVAGLVARQIVFLPAGKYRLSSVVVQSSQPTGSGPHWDLACTDGRSVGSLEMGQAATGRSRFQVDVVVPQNCPAFALTLQVRASDDVQGTTGQIDSVSLVRVN